jgi:hypothetical protein
LTPAAVNLDFSLTTDPAHPGPPIKYPVPYGSNAAGEPAALIVRIT